MVKVSVVVPHFEDLPALDRCLTALVSQTYPGAEFEIVVADNDSPSGREKVERTLAGRARLVTVTTKERARLGMGEFGLRRARFSPSLIPIVSRCGVG
jgi:glycosyltransferase involved in cell wall biosynthesis